ncbi:FAD-dependent oxidoreductase [Nocardia brasiliensis]|uniref:FAD-dependent oxidoreductase n=1 Tax=Nocardia brasiliensis TaxID=37326 RepID=UPI0037B404FB
MTVVERDRLPAQPTPRPGVRQGRQLHALPAGGARAIETLLPGTLDSLGSAGALRIDMPGRALVYGPYGWIRPFPPRQYLIGCTRPLLEHVIRIQLLRQHPITVLEATDATGLIGNSRQVRGVHTRDRDTGVDAALTADLVIDATGRGSKTPRWLLDLGLPPAPTTVVDSGIIYASRIVQAPPHDIRQYPFVAIQADPGSRTPGRAGFLLRIEGDRWIIALYGTRGAAPPVDEHGFAQFAHSLRHPLISDLIQRATPLTRIYGFGHTANRRHHFEQLPTWPQHLLVIGDAATSLNPIYAHGMSVAAHSATALHTALANHRDARTIQRTIARTGNLAWLISTTSDIRYPQILGAQPTWRHAVLTRCMDRFIRTAATHPGAAAAFIDVFTLSAPLSRVATPSVAAATIRGPRLPPLQTPPALWQQHLNRPM